MKLFACFNDVNTCLTKHSLSFRQIKYCRLTLQNDSFNSYVLTYTTTKHLIEGFIGEQVNVNALASSKIPFLIIKYVEFNLVKLMFVRV